jgi:hypothetical protein
MIWAKFRLKARATMATGWQPAPGLAGYSLGFQLHWRIVIWSAMVREVVSARPAAART